ncbi:MAG: hypothetical protein AB7I98_01660 [Verrucomicrobiales bacterium]|nr:hypothetical protein [Akkermansiaceae bacterium]
MKRYFCHILAISLAALSAQAQSQLALQNSPAYEAVAARLRGSMPRDYDYQGAILADVLRVMASDAGLSFFGLPDGTPEAERLVTFSIKASPFTAMETLAKANGISLIFENGMWYLRPANDTELVGRVYQINYNTQETVTKTNGGSGMGIAGGSSGGGSSSGAGLNLQGAQETFKIEPSRLLDDIKAVLDLPTNGALATIAPMISVDTMSDLSARNLPGRPDVLVQGQRPVDAKGKPVDDSNRAKVIWNSDSNTLYVVATRQQHQWIEGYLASADKPQTLIAVEIKFIETSKDPSREFGIDWSQTFGGGWGVQANIPPHEVDLTDIQNSFTLPAAILSYDEINVKLRALFEDRNTKTTSYPRMLTLNNREVVFRSVVNQPVLANSSSTSLGAGATSTTAVDYLPIGTVVNILPKKMDDGNIMLNVAITISDIIGEKIIEGNPFPIASSRVYTAPVQVQSGFTVAISGLDSARTEDYRNGIPVLGRIPIIRHVFGSTSKRNSKNHLMMLITPVLMDPTGPGVSKKPISRDPWANLPPSTPEGEMVPPPAPQEAPRHYRTESAEVTPVPVVAPVAMTAPVAPPVAAESRIPQPEAAPTPVRVAQTSAKPYASVRRHDYTTPITGKVQEPTPQRHTLVAHPIPAPAAVARIEDTTAPMSASQRKGPIIDSTLESKTEPDTSSSMVSSSALGE